MGEKRSYIIKTGVKQTKEELAAADEFANWLQSLEDRKLMVRFTAEVVDDQGSK